MGSAQAHYECVRVLSESEFFDDLKAIDVPVLVMHGEDDQICLLESRGAKSVKLLPQVSLKTYPGFPHGMPTRSMLTCGCSSESLLLSPLKPIPGLDSSGGRDSIPQSALPTHLLPVLID